MEAAKNKKILLKRKAIVAHLRSIYSGMKQRCTNPNLLSYKHYGGRGIQNCFTSCGFVDYVMNVLQVDPRGLTIDRIDTNGHYEPGNIRFVTRAENNKNKRHSPRFTEPEVMPPKTKKPKERKPVLSDRQIKAYMLISSEFQGKTTAEAAEVMGITLQAFNRLISRAEQACPQIFPMLTKQEADVLALLELGYSNFDLANQLGVSLSRVSQIVGSLHDKGRVIGSSKPVKILHYESYMDSQVVEKF